MHRLLSLGALLVLISIAAGAAAPRAHASTIVVTTTIQAAVDAAQPGDTVVVPPGVYRESVLVDKSAITIRGSRGAVIDAAGFRNGIAVGTGRITIGPNGFPACPPLSLHDVTIDGLTVRNADRNGVLLRGVDGFEITGGRYVDNVEYGIFPICSANGLISRNDAQGTEDAAIYVGDDHWITVEENVATDSLAGLEVENSANVTAIRNHFARNTAGIAVFVLPGLPVPFVREVVIEHNVVVQNNRPNPYPPGVPEGAIPAGSGILVLSADRVRIHSNVVTGNDSLGVALATSPLAGLDPRVDPTPDGNTVLDNVVIGNGRRPDLLRALSPGADLVYDGTGSGNCFANNVFSTDFPSGITELFACAALP